MGTSTESSILYGLQLAADWAAAGVTAASEMTKHAPLSVNRGEGHDDTTISFKIDWGGGSGRDNRDADDDGQQVPPPTMDCDATKADDGPIPGDLRIAFMARMTNIVIADS
jgi:hypothetical protein